MPLFHIHGLIAGVLAPLSAGSQVFCTPGFNALKFFAWMDEAKPTWYTAVPTMHQAILTRLQNLEVIARHPLRFLRSSSSSMPPQVIGELEQVFKAPLIEAYGMTEATHQMCSNLLPPAVRKPGTVGPSGGPEAAIMAEDGTLLARGETGEIVIRGPNVTAGYESNQGERRGLRQWLVPHRRPGRDGCRRLRVDHRAAQGDHQPRRREDQPREIDEDPDGPPAVAQVVCFGMPHPKLGEEVAAVVVLREGQQATERELQEFVAQRAADFKVPKAAVHDRDPQGRDRQPAAHRAGRQARPRLRPGAIAIRIPSKHRS